MTNIETLEREYRAAVTDLEASQRLLGQTPREDPTREQRRHDVEVALGHVARAKEAIKQANTRRVFAGIGGPLHEACVAKLPADVVAELEVDALLRQEERERRAAERRAAKAAAGTSTPATPTSPAPAAPPPQPTRGKPPEVFHTMPRARSGAAPAPAVATPQRDPRPPPATGLRREVHDAFAEARRR